MALAPEPTKATRRKMSRYLAHRKNGLNNTAAAAKLGVERTLPHQWMAAYPEFKAAVQQVQQEREQRMDDDSADYLDEAMQDRQQWAILQARKEAAARREQSRQAAPPSSEDDWNPPAVVP